MTTTLIQRLTGILCPDTPTYLVIDPLANEPILLPGVDASAFPAQIQRAREAAWGSDVHPITLDPSIDLAQHLHPYLVTLPAVDNEPLLLQSMTLAQAEQQASQAGGLGGESTGAHCMGGWLQSTLAVQELAQCLAKACSIDPELPTKARYVRLADRRVLDWLRFVVGDNRIPFIAHLSRWVYLDARGGLAKLDGQKHPTPAAPLKFLPAEWEEFSRGEYHHKIAAQWLGECAVLSPTGAAEPPLGLFDGWPRIAHALTLAVEVASRYPAVFLTTDDQVAWATLTLLHPHLQKPERQPAVLDTPHGQRARALHTRRVALHRALTQASAS